VVRCRYPPPLRKLPVRSGAGGAPPYKTPGVVRAPPVDRDRWTVPGGPTCVVNIKFMKFSEI
jgi:hypothetical protein